MPSVTDDRQFIDEIASQLPAGLLNTAIDWIKSNLLPSDFFEEEQLIDWAECNDFKKSD